MDHFGNGILPALLLSRSVLFQEGLVPLIVHTFWDGFAAFEIWLIHFISIA